MVATILATAKITLGVLSVLVIGEMLMLVVEE